MPNFYYEAGIVSLAVVLVAGLDAIFRRKNDNIQQELALGMMIWAMVVIVSNSLSNIFDGQTDAVARVLNPLFNNLLYAAPPAGIVLWFLYVDYDLRESRKELRRSLPWAFLAWGILLIVLLINLRFGFIFSFDRMNHYHREGGLWPYALYCYAMVICAVGFILHHRKKTNLRHLIMLLSYPLPTVIGSLVQTISGQSTFTSGGIAISILLLYNSMQDKSSSTDPLTGLYNRRQLDWHIGNKIRTRSGKSTFAGMLIDLSRFKNINDTLGHEVGDMALQDMAHVLHTCLRRNDFIARYGGDEFFLVLSISTQATLERTALRIRNNVEAFNASRNRPYTLDFDVGYALYPVDKRLSREEFIHMVDQRMYAARRERRRASEQDAALAKAPDESL